MPARPDRVDLVLPPAATTPTARRAAAPATAEPPPVRVHIGRLEVRANLQPAPPRRPERTETTDEALSLGDFLRGRRRPA
ncbi:MAG TPA: hypothetical protein VH721_03615 [Gaiellaceae bacterium]